MGQIVSVVEHSTESGQGGDNRTRLLPLRLRMYAHGSQHRSHPDRPADRTTRGGSKRCRAASQACHSSDLSNVPLGIRGYTFIVVKV